MFRTVSTSGNRRWGAVRLATVVFALSGAIGSAAEPPSIPAGYRMIAPALAWQGETFSGAVVADTDQGPTPLSEGDQVVFNGQVVQAVKSGGVIDLPLEAIAGIRPASQTQRETCPDCTPQDFQFSGTVVRAFGKPVRGSQALVTGRVQQIPLPNRAEEAALGAIQPRIARISDIATSGQPFSVYGQGLNQLRRAALLTDDDSAIPLGQSVGSSLHRIYLLPGDMQLPKGMLRFVAWDEEGHRLQAPQPTKNPRLKLEGTHITRTGEPGEIKVLSDTSGLVQLTGGQPHISVYQQPFPVQANLPKTARFQSLIVGPYTVAGRFWNPEFLPPAPDAKRAIVGRPSVQYEYDARSNLVRVEVPVQVHDEQGMPMRDVPVDVAVVHPQGAEYAAATTDPLGHAVATFELPGKVAPTAIVAHVFRLPGMPWLPQEEPKCKGCSVSIVNVWADYNANAVDPKLAKVMGKSLDNLAVQWSHSGQCDCKPGQIHIHTYMATLGGGKVNSNGDVGKEDAFEDPNSSCTPGATGFWTKNFINGAVGLYYKGSIRVYAECHDCGAKSTVWSDSSFEKYDKLKDNEAFKAYLKKLKK